MKNIFAVVALFGFIACDGAWAVSAGTVSGTSSTRSVYGQNGSASGQRGGNQMLANAYKANQMNTYYMVTQPDVDSACRTRI